MSKLELYPTLSIKKNCEEVKLMMIQINFYNSQNSLFEIAETLNTPI